MILLCFKLLLLFLIGQVNVLRSFINSLSEHLISLGHFSLLFLIVRLVWALLFLGSLWL
jgi:hypothetical protein